MNIPTVGLGSVRMVGQSEKAETALRTPSRIPIEIPFAQETLTNHLRTQHARVLQ